MSKLKLSQWHDGNVKPVHVGVYERFTENWFSFWDGNKWMFGADFKREAAVSLIDTPFQSNYPWRGIVK